MICFPNAKINLGLHISGKRSDGYHSIETVFYPVPLCDALEAVVSDQLSFRQTGLPLDSSPDDNLVMKAYRLMAAKYKLPPLEIHLKKTIPSGAGLGGGSADAAFMLQLLNSLCECGISDDKLQKKATDIGADCPFFIHNKPVIATGTGNVFKSTNLSLKSYTIYIIKPPVTVSTREAYSMVKPSKQSFALDKLTSLPVSDWKHVLKNDFEPAVFDKHPIIGEIKDYFYNLGADYASMSGSGSAVYGLFKNTISSPVFPNCFVWTGTLA